MASIATPDFSARVQELVNLYNNAEVSVAQALCDKHDPASIAFRIVHSDLSVETLTYGDLKAESERFGNALRSLGVGPGDRVATLMGKSRELVVALVAIWRIGAVYIPLFTAFAPPAISLRLKGGRPKVVITDADQASKVNEVEEVDEACQIVVVGTAQGMQKATHDFGTLLKNGAVDCQRQQLGGDAPFIQIYTSGTTGTPKGVVVPSRAIAGFHAYGDFALGLRDDDIYWCAADPGWAYGLYFGLVCSLATGVSSVLLKGGFSAERMLKTLELCDVTNLTAAPTTYRSLLASGLTPPANLKLRCASAAGEPLTPDVNEWAVKALGVAVADHYGQTEAGMAINNHHHPALKQPIKPGSMGIGMPGFAPVVLQQTEEVLAATGELGRVAIDVSKSPFAWFDGYLDAPDKTAEKFTSDRKWYLTGDLGMVDDEGYFHFESREDDVILMAGYRIGPFEIESTLLQHPAVLEAAAIAVPDTIRGELLEAYVVLYPTTPASDQLGIELQEWVKRRYAAHAYPRQIHFVNELPKTPSGKLQRNVLRQWRRDELLASAQPSQSA